jgi:hypothetical protein
MLYLDSSPARIDIFCKKEEEKEKEWFILCFKGEEKLSYKLSYMEDFEVNVEISEETILFKLKGTR